MLNKKLLYQIGIAVGLVGLAVAWRIINDTWGIVYNLELVTAVSLVAAVFLHRYFALVVQ